jgi:hypothetical protein
VPFDGACSIGSGQSPLLRPKLYLPYRELQAIAML